MFGCIFRHAAVGFFAESNFKKFFAKMVNFSEKAVVYIIVLQKAKLQCFCKEKLLYCMEVSK